MIVNSGRTKKGNSLKEEYIRKRKSTHDYVKRITQFKSLLDKAKKSSLRSYEDFFEGELALLRGDHDEAKKKLEAACKYAETRALAYCALGNVYIASRPPEWAKAEKSIQEALKADPNYAFALNSL